jgi:branched-chain amino acid transport system permease protein
MRDNVLLKHTLFGDGPVTYVLLSAYAIAVSGAMLLNPRTSLITDTLFALFLLLMLILYQSRVSIWYKVIVAALALGVVLPYFGTMNQFYIDVATQAGIFVALALGLNVVVGLAGLLDLGYVAFFAVGAYLWGIVSTPQITQINPAWSPVPPDWFFIFLFIGLIVGAITGILLGLPVLRLRGDYLAIVTLGFGEVIRVLAINLDTPINITNGAQGIGEIARPTLPFVETFRAMGVNLSDSQFYLLYFYGLVLVIVLLTILVVSRLNNSRIGRAWTAVREDETAAIAMGIPLVRTKLLAFAVGASFAGTMGVVFAAKQLFINPPTFDLIRSIIILSMVILGGMGSIPGAILGAIIVTLLDLMILRRIAEVLRELQQGGVPIPTALDPTQYQRMLFGMLLILMMIFRPEGLLPEDRRRAELHRDEPVPPPGTSNPPPATDPGQAGDAS